MRFLVEFKLANGDTCTQHIMASSMRMCDEMAENETLNDPQLKGCKSYDLYVNVEDQDTFII